MGARSVSDLDAFLNLVVRYRNEAQVLLEQVRVAQGMGRDWVGLMKLAITVQQKSQLSREAIEIATNCGSWIEEEALCLEKWWKSRREKGENRSPASATCARVEGGPSMGSPRRIVVVDDDALACEILGLLLLEWFKDATLVVFNNPVEALEELLRGDPDLLITDDHMPRLSGAEMVGRLLDRKVGYRIVVRSADDRSGRWVQEYASEGLNVAFLPALSEDPVADLRRVVSGI